MASKQAIQKVTQQIFGTAPQLNKRTGNKLLKKPLIGAYLQRYYPESIEKSARKVSYSQHRLNFSYFVPLSFENRNECIFKSSFKFFFHSRCILFFLFQRPYLHIQLTYKLEEQRSWKPYVNGVKVHLKRDLEKRNRICNETVCEESYLVPGTILTRI